MSSNGTTVEDAEMVECDGEKVVTMMDVLQEQQEFEDDANAVLGASDDKNCTYSQGYIKRQAVYACLTCCEDAKIDPEKRAGVCLACSLTCHENHDLVELYTKRNFCCDCGNPKFTHPCQYTKNKTTLNNDNTYNQNFSGLYCICHRPYPDPDGVEEEMIQCILCEDWLHASHLEAIVPSSELYAEMICKACMEKNEFLYDYGKYAVNSDVDVVSVNEIVDPIQCNGDLTKLNGVNVEAGSDKSEREETKVSDEKESSVKANNNDNNAEEKTQAKDSSAEDTVINNPVEKNQAIDVSDKAVDENPAGENQAIDVSDKAIDDNPAGKKQAIDVSDKAVDENPAGENQAIDVSDKAIDDNPAGKKQAIDVSDKAVDENPEGENHDINVSDKAVDENPAGENQAIDVSDNAVDENPGGENQAIDVSDKAIDENPAGENQDKDISDKTDDENLEENQSESKNDKKVPTFDGISDMKSSDNLPNRSMVQGSLNDAPIDSTEANTESITNIEDSTVSMDTKVTEKNEHESPSNIPQESNGVVIDQDVKDVELENTNQDKADPADPNITSATDSSIQMDENLQATDNHLYLGDEQIKENKRKLSTEDSDDVSFKKAKLSENRCLRPKKGEKRIFKGATFWPSHFRQKLCTCNECIAMYKDLSVLFLIDPEDTVTAYEALGKEKSDGTASTQYEKGLEALSSLGRIQQINALTEYNKMRDKLLDFLKSFKDRKEVVKEEDIKAFFAGMKPKREPDGVYFCR